MEKCRISFYKILRCGYFQYSSLTPEFGSTKETLLELKQWACQQGMQLDQTCTYDTQEERNTYRTFCFNLISSNNDQDFLLTTWNELPGSSGKMASVKGEDAVGSAKVNLTEIPQGSIPGYATYFWIIPQKDLFATLQFANNFNGRKNLDNYLTGFLSKFSQNVCTEPDLLDNNSTKILGYRDSGTTSLPQNLNPQFHSCLYKKPGAIAYVKSNRVNIRKICKRETFNLSTETKPRLWQSILTSIGISDGGRPTNNSERLEFSCDFTPSEDELSTIIDFWDSQNHDIKWDDIGFRLNGEDRTYWLSKSFARGDLNLDVTRDNDEIINSRSLLDQLLINRERCFSLLT
jgi:hypothetical protein